MKSIKTFEEYEVNEEFDPMIGIQHFLNDPIMIAVAAAWLVGGKFSIENMKSSTIAMKDDFISFCNAMGYHIDKDALDEKFESLINKVSKILKIKS